MMAHKLGPILLMAMMMMVVIRMVVMMKVRPEVSLEEIRPRLRPWRCR